MTGSRAGDGRRERVVLSLGSNLGDRMANLQLGVDVLVAGGLACAAVSGVFETAPVGGPEQADYLNAVLLAVTCAACERHPAACAPPRKPRPAGCAPCAGPRGRWMWTSSPAVMRSATAPS